MLKNKWKKHKYEKEGESKLELEKYLDEDIEKDCENFDILDWWKFNCSRFPITGNIVRDVLAVPIFTVALESAFSISRKVLDVFRSSLAPLTVQSLVCYHDWLCSSPIPLCIEEHME